MTEKEFNDFLEQYEIVREKVLEILDKLLIWTDPEREAKKPLFPEYYVKSYAFSTECDYITVELLSKKNLNHDLYIGIPNRFIYEGYTEEDLIKEGETEYDIEYEEDKRGL